MASGPNPIFSSSVPAVVLAGGRGRRIAALYPEMPKPMIPVAGRPFLHWVTAWLVAQGLTDIVYSTGYMAEKVEAWAAGADFGADVRLACRREPVALGTGGGIVNCLDLAGDTFLALNGDSLVVTNLATLAAPMADDDVDASVLALEVDDTARYGTLEIDDAGRLTRFAEKQPGGGFINGGVYFLRSRVFAGRLAGTACSMEHDVLPELIDCGGRVAAHVASSAPFLDIGTPESIVLADDFISRHRGVFGVRGTVLESN